MRRNRSVFEVQARMCATCIYRPDNPLDVDELVNACRDEHGSLIGHRQCHHSERACCAGFWARHKDDFLVGRMAQALCLVRTVEDDDLR